MKEGEEKKRLPYETRVLPSRATVIARETRAKRFIYKRKESTKGEGGRDSPAEWLRTGLIKGVYLYMRADCNALTT